MQSQVTIYVFCFVVNISKENQQNEVTFNQFIDLTVQVPEPEKTSIQQQWCSLRYHLDVTFGCNTQHSCVVRCKDVILS